MLRHSTMKTNQRGRAFPGLVVVLALMLGAGSASAAEAPADRVLQPDRYTSDRFNEPLVEGFTVIVSWLKIEPAAGQPPVFETAATFLPKSLAGDYLRGRINIAQLANGAQLLAWDGETKLGAIKPKAWVD